MALWLHQMVFPGWRQRLVAVDHGRRRVKLLLGELRGGRFHPLEAVVVDLQEEGLVTTEEVQRHLVALTHRWGEWPLAVVLPPRLSFSQVLEVPPPAGWADIPRLIEEQTARLRGMGQGPWVYEAVPLPPQGRWQQPCFLTVARQEDVERHLEETTAPVTEVRHVSSAARALTEAWQWLGPPASEAWLLEVGTEQTLMVRVRDGRPVLATTEIVGANSWVERLAALRGCSATEAENLLQQQALFAGPAAVPELAGALREWWTRLQRAVQEARQLAPGWEEGGPEPALYVSGGPVHWPGFVEAIRIVSGRSCLPWPQAHTRQGPLCMSDFALAVGTGVHAFAHPVQEPSLLPPSLRAHGRHLRQLATLLSVALVFLGLVGLLLGVGLWRKTQRVAEKQALLQQAESALARLRELDQAARVRDGAFVRYWALLDQQERTLDVLETLRALQEVRKRHDFWTVLVADADSYARGASKPVADTNGAALLVQTWLQEPPANPSFVVELCIPAGGEETLKILSELVTDLRQDSRIARVDSLPAAQRRGWVDAKVIIPDRHFVLGVDMVDAGWRGLFQTVRLPEARWGTNWIRRPALWTASRARSGAPGPGSGPSAAGRSPE